MSSITILGNSHNIEGLVTLELRMKECQINWINTPFGGFTYEWEKDLKKFEADINNAKSILRSFVVSIESGENVKSEEIDLFLQTLRNFGRLAKLKGTELNDYERLVSELKERY